MVSLSSSAMVSANSSLRFIDGKMGLLSQPIGESVAWLGDQIKKGIIPFESISVQAQQAVNVVFSIEEALQQLIASVVQSILNFILAKITEIIGQLAGAIKQISGVFDKLKELGQGFVNSLQGLSAIKDLIPQISDATSKLMPTTGKAQNAVYSGITSFATCETLRDTQLKLPANERSSVPDQSTCDNLKFNTEQVAVKAQCGELKIPLSALLGVSNACPTQVATSVGGKADEIAKKAKQGATVKIDTINAKAPDGCKFVINKDINIFQSGTAAPGAGLLNFTSGGSTKIDFSTPTFSLSSGDVGSGIPDVKLDVPSPKECEFWKSGELTTTTAALAADKSVPSVKDGGLQAIFNTFIQQVQKIVQDFVNDIIKFAQDFVNQFISTITSIAGGIPVLGQYISGITSGLSSQGSALKNLAVSCIQSPCNY